MDSMRGPAVPAQRASVLDQPRTVSSDGIVNLEIETLPFVLPAKYVVLGEFCRESGPGIRGRRQNGSDNLASAVHQFVGFAAEHRRLDELHLDRSVDFNQFYGLKQDTRTADVHHFSDIPGELTNLAVMETRIRQDAF